MENALAIGLWIPAITKAAGVLEIPPQKEVFWLFLLLALTLSAASRKGDRAAVGLAIYATVVSALMAMVVLLTPIDSSRWMELGAIYGKLAAYASLLLVNYILTSAGRENKAPAWMALFALVLAVDVLFVMKLRDEGLAMSLAAIPGLAAAVGQYASSRGGQVSETEVET